jgi:hypothetical protein
MMKWQDDRKHYQSVAWVGSFEARVHRIIGASTVVWKGQMFLKGAVVYTTWSAPTATIAKARIEKELMKLLSEALKELNG